MPSGDAFEKTGLFNTFAFPEPETFPVTFPETSAPKHSRSIHPRKCHPRNFVLSIPVFIKSSIALTLVSSVSYLPTHDVKRVLIFAGILFSNNAKAQICINSWNTIVYVFLQTPPVCALTVGNAPFFIFKPFHLRFEEQRFSPPLPCRRPSANIATAHCIQCWKPGPCTIAGCGGQFGCGLGGHLFSG